MDEIGRFSDKQIRLENPDKQVTDLEIEEIRKKWEKKR